MIDKMKQSNHKLFFKTLKGRRDRINPMDSEYTIDILRSNISSEQKTRCSAGKFLQRARNLSRQLSTSHMSPKYRYLYQKCSITPTLSCLLISLSLSDEQHERIHKIIHKDVAVCKGFNQHCPRELRYIHHRYCSLEITYLKVNQSLRKIQFLHKMLFDKKIQNINPSNDRVVSCVSRNRDSDIRKT